MKCSAYPLPSLYGLHPPPLFLQKHIDTPSYNFSGYQIFGLFLISSVLRFFAILLQDILLRSRDAMRILLFFAII